MSDQNLPEEEPKTEFTFEPETPFKYASKGETREAEFVVLSAPTSKHRRECSFLKQAFMRAMNEHSSDAEDAVASSTADARKQEITGSDVIDLISMSTRTDLNDVIEAGKRLVTGGVALVDGEEKLTPHLFDCMSYDDAERLVGDYLAFFPLRSSLRRLSGSSSDSSSS